LPWFGSASTGQVLDRYANNNKDKKIIVLCGHTHSPGIYVRDNVTVYTGGAEYGNPQIAGEIYEDKIIAFDSQKKKVENKLC
jgi:predicted phosphodiesterase